MFDWNIFWDVVKIISAPTGIIMFLLSVKERRVAARLKSGEADVTDLTTIKMLREAYRELTKDVMSYKKEADLKIGQMEQEIGMLRKIIEKQPKQCDNCPLKN